MFKSYKELSDNWYQYDAFRFVYTIKAEDGSDLELLITAENQLPAEHNDHKYVVTARIWFGGNSFGDTMTATLNGDEMIDVVPDPRAGLFNKMKRG